MSRLAPRQWCFFFSLAVCPSACELGWVPPLPLVEKEKCSRRDVCTPWFFHVTYKVWWDGIRMISGTVFSFLIGKKWKMDKNLSPVASKRESNKICLKSLLPPPLEIKWGESGFQPPPFFWFYTPGPGATSTPFSVVLFPAIRVRIQFSFSFLAFPKLCAPLLSELCFLHFFLAIREDYGESTDRGLDFPPSCREKIWQFRILIPPFPFCFLWTQLGEQTPCRSFSPLCGTLSI